MSLSELLPAGGEGPSEGVKRGRPPGETKYPFTIRLTHDEQRFLEERYGWVQRGIAAVLRSAMAQQLFDKVEEKKNDRPRPKKG